VTHHAAVIRSVLYAFGAAALALLCFGAGLAAGHGQIAAEISALASEVAVLHHADGVTLAQLNDLRTRLATCK
jgi:hypothetical protein